MRVHPSSVGSKKFKWQYLVAVVLFGMLVASSLFRGPKQNVVAQGDKPQGRMISVLIAKKTIETGDPLNAKLFKVEKRLVSTLPSDIVTSWDALKNTVAAGPIPAGYPLAETLLAEPVAVVPVVEEPKEVVPQEDPVDLLLRSIENDTVAIPVSFSNKAPERGSRVAITISKGRGDSAVLVDECWIANASSRDAIARVKPTQALLLQSAVSYGILGFIKLAPKGPSPYAGSEVKSIAELRSLLDGKRPVQPVVVEEPKKDKMQGYAWVSGEGGVRLGIDGEGTIKVVESE